MNNKDLIMEELKNYYKNHEKENWTNFFSGKNSLVNVMKTNDGIKILMKNEYGLLGNLIYEIKDDKKLIKELSKIEKELCEYYYREFQLYNYDDRYLPYVFRNDRQVVLEAVKQDGLTLGFASKRLQNDKEVVLEAIKEDARSLRYASKRLQNDKEVVLESIRQCGFELKFASKRLQNDKEVVLESIRQCGELKFASKRLQNDKEVILEAEKFFKAYYEGIK